MCQPFFVHVITCRICYIFYMVIYFVGSRTVVICWLRSSESEPRKKTDPFKHSDGWDGSLFDVIPIEKNWTHLDWHYNEPFAELVTFLSTNYNWTSSSSNQFFSCIVFAETSYSVRFSNSSEFFSVHCVQFVVELIICVLV